MRQNEMKLEFDSRSCNEGFARVAVAAFMTQLNPTLEEVADVKTAVSEAVTNAIIHAYEGRVEKITVLCRIEGEVLYVEVRDSGKGIADVKRAMEPMFTTKAECDRAGMGFAFMEAFMDTLDVQSALGEGTTVRMTKRIVREAEEGPRGCGRTFPSGSAEEAAATSAGGSGETEGRDAASAIRSGNTVEISAVRSENAESADVFSTMCSRNAGEDSAVRSGNAGETGGAVIVEER